MRDSAAFTTLLSVIREANSAWGYEASAKTYYTQLKQLCSCPKFQRRTLLSPNFHTCAHPVTAHTRSIQATITYVGERLALGRCLLQFRH